MYGRAGVRSGDVSPLAAAAGRASVATHSCAACHARRPLARHAAHDAKRAQAPQARRSARETTTANASPSTVPLPASAVRQRSKEPGPGVAAAPHTDTTTSPGSMPAPSFVALPGTQPSSTARSSPPGSAGDASAAWQSVAIMWQRRDSDVAQLTSARKLGALRHQNPEPPAHLAQQQRVLCGRRGAVGVREAEAANASGVRVEYLRSERRGPLARSRCDGGPPACAQGVSCSGWCLEVEAEVEGAWRLGGGRCGGAEAWSNTACRTPFLNRSQFACHGCCNAARRAKTSAAVIGADSAPLYGATRRRSCARARPERAQPRSRSL